MSLEQALSDMVGAQPLSSQPPVSRRGGAYSSSSRSIGGSSTRKVPHGSTQGSCIYIDSDDSDDERERTFPHVSQSTGQVWLNRVKSVEGLSRFYSNPLSNTDPNVSSPVGQSSAPRALVRLTEEWHHGYPPEPSGPGYSAPPPPPAMVSSAFNEQPADLPSAGSRIVLGVTTTLMMRNIPIRFTPSTLRDVIDSEGFVGLYDYLYMPMDFRSHRSMGYAFINFCHPGTADAFAAHFQDRRLASTNSAKVLSITGAIRQGLRPNIASFKASTLKQMPREEFRPVVLVSGKLFPVNESICQWIMAGKNCNGEAAGKLRTSSPRSGSSGSASSGLSGRGDKALPTQLLVQVSDLFSIS
jgi:hypothetical protein